MPEPMTDSECVTKGQRYVDHEITKTMLLNNMDVYNDVRDEGFGIRLFERSFRKRK